MFKPDDKMVLMYCHGKMPIYNKELYKNYYDLNETNKLVVTGNKTKMNFNKTQQLFFEIPTNVIICSSTQICYEAYVNNLEHTLKDDLEERGLQELFMDTASKSSKELRDFYNDFGFYSTLCIFIEN